MKILNIVLYAVLGFVLGINHYTFVTGFYWQIMGCVLAIHLTAVLGTEF